MLEYVKIRCPTCWNETYITVTDGRNSDQENRLIDELKHPGHDRPIIERRDEGRTN